MKDYLPAQTKKAELEIFQKNKNVVDKVLASENAPSLSDKQVLKLHKNIEEESKNMLVTSLSAISDNPDKNNSELLPIVLKDLSNKSKIRFIRKLAKKGLIMINKEEYKI